MSGTYTGKVTRPDFDSGDKNVKLTATVTKGIVTRTISFDTIVKKLGITDGQSVIKDLASILLAKDTKTNIDLPLVGTNGSKITWSSDSPEVITDTGVITRPTVGQGASVAKLTATVKKGTESQTKQFDINVLPWTLDDEIEDAKNLLKWSTIAGDNDSIQTVKADLVFPSTIGRSVNVTWVTSNKAFCTDAGKVTRPTYTQGPVVINVTATLSKDDKSAQVTISGIRLEPFAITNGEIALDTVNKLDSSSFVGGNESLSNIVTDMILPSTMDDQLSYYCAITWSLVTEGNEPTTSQYITLTQKSSHTECKITRPTLEQGNFVTYLKATVTANDPDGGDAGTSIKRFRVIVVALEE